MTSTSDFNWWCASLQNTYYFLTGKTVPWDLEGPYVYTMKFLRNVHAARWSARSAAVVLADTSGDRARHETEVAHSVRMRIEDDARKAAGVSLIVGPIA